MGLDWTIVFDETDSTEPNRAYQSTDIELIESADYIPAEGSLEHQQQAASYDQPWSFRAEHLSTIDLLSDELHADCYRDMAPPQMETLAQALAREAAQLESELSEEDHTTITEASEWLAYWADQNRWILACY